MASGKNLGKNQITDNTHKEYLVDIINGLAASQERAQITLTRLNENGHDLTTSPRSVRSVLCITLEPIGQKMAGPAIRCLELARQLAEDFKVTVFSPHKVSEPYGNSLPQRLRLVVGKNKSELYKLAEESDALFIQASVLKTYPQLVRLKKYFIVDLYDPYLLSVLVQYQQDVISQRSVYRWMHKVLERHMAIADFSICASEKQRDYWLGRFCAMGRLTPEIYRFDPAVRKLIDVVPFGVPNEPPLHKKPGIRGLVEGIAKSDKLLVWGGGIWEWFDPLTVIKAVAHLKGDIPHLRLFFMGMKSPNPLVPPMDMPARAMRLSEDLGLLNKHIFFAPAWISYEDRADYLLEADAAVSAHYDSIETWFSFRTRILDYLWAGVPILTTTGDELAQLIETKGAGFSLPYEDPIAWAQAISKLILNHDLEKKCREQSRNLAQQFTWQKVVKPIHQFLARPYHLPDYRKITMPSVFERAQAVYARGGTDLVLKQSREILNDFWR